MAIKIKINNSTITQEARVFNNATIKDSADIDVEISDTKINGNAVLWENLNIEPVLNELKQKVGQIDRNSPEFSEVQKILQVKNWNRKEFIKCATKHVAEFSQGVLASIIANYIS